MVRSCKEKRSAFAPLPQKIKQKNEKGQETEVVNTLCCRYDGIYRIFKAWRRPTNAKVRRTRGLPRHMRSVTWLGA